MLVHLIEVGLTLNCKNFSTVVLHSSLIRKRICNKNHIEVLVYKNFIFISFCYIANEKASYVVSSVEME